MKIIFVISILATPASIFADEARLSLDLSFRESGLSSRFCDGPFMGSMAMRDAKQKTAYSLDLREASCRALVGQEHYDHPKDTTYLVESVDVNVKFNSKLSSCTRSREDSCLSKQSIYCIAYFDVTCKFEGVAIPREVIRARPFP